MSVTKIENEIKVKQKPKNWEFLHIKQLPDNFAQDVLDLEIKIEQTKFTMEDVDRLIFLYSQAIEHYEGVDNDKYLSFYQRTQRLLNKPAVFEVMKAYKKTTKRGVIAKENSPSQSNTSAVVWDRTSTKLFHRGSFLTPSRKRLEMDILLMQEEKKEKQQHLLKNHDQVVNMKSELLENDIIAQKRNLELRLLRRKTHKNVSSKKTKNYPRIGVKDESNDEYSTIIAKLNPSFNNESWTEENYSLLREFNSTQDKTDSTDFKEDPGDDKQSESL